MNFRLVNSFLFLSIIVACVTLILFAYYQTGPDSIKIVAFIAQLLGVSIPLFFISKDALRKLPPFKKRELIEDSKSSNFDLRRNEHSDRDWRNSNESERKILDLQYKIDDLTDQIKILNFHKATYEIWFRIVWDNFDYLTDYSPKEKAQDQIWLIVSGAILTVFGAFLGFWNIEVYQLIYSFFH